LAEIAKKQRSNKTVEMRRMIDATALVLGLTPVAPRALSDQLVEGQRKDLAKVKGH